MLVLQGQSVIADSTTEKHKIGVKDDCISLYFIINNKIDYRE